MIINTTDMKIIENLLSLGSSPNFISYISSNEIARKSNIAYSDAHKSLKKLENKRIIKFNKIGNMLAPHYNFQNTFAGTITEMYKSKRFFEKYPIIKKFFQEMINSIKITSYIILIFGSYAKNNFEKNSDIDIMIISDENNLDKIESSFKKTKRLFAIKTDIHLITYSEFLEMLSQAPKINIATEAYNNHIIVYGAEEYMNNLRLISNEK